MTLEIKQCSILDLKAADNFDDLVEEYAAESAVPGLPHPSVKIEMYVLLGNSGAMRFWGAYFNNELIGFITVLAPVIPHFGVQIAVSESFFVTSRRRNTGAGLKLLRLAEAYAASVGSPGLLISAPLGSILAEVLPRVGYVETNRVFFRKTR